MAIEHGELTHECFPKHSRMGTARTKQDKETDDGNKRGVSMERSKAGTNKRSSDGLSHPNQKYNNNKHNLLVFYKILKKFNDIQLTKNKIDLN